MRIVVTGLGMITATGTNVAECWGSLLNGVSGARDITSFDTSKYKLKRACQVPFINKTTPIATDKEIDSVGKLAYLAALEAIDDSGLFTKAFYAPERVGLSVGTLGEVAMLERSLRRNSGHLGSSLDKNLIDAFSLNLMVGSIADRFGVLGSVSTHLNGCSSGTHAAAYGYDLITDGIVDAMIVGGADTLAQIVFTNFHNLKNLAPEHCQPFDMHRKGLMLGGGAGFLILEREDLAKRRGARILCEMNGYGWSCDGYHITSPHPDGEGGARAMQNALDCSQLSYKEIDYINPHGTGTILNDAAETKAIKTVFHERAYQVPVSSTKSMIGHPMGAASAIESVIACLAVQNNVIPPTINYETPDPECDLDYVPNAARELPVKYAMNNSFSFGGNNVVIIFGKV